MHLRSFSSLFVTCGALAVLAGCTVKINETDGDSASGSSGAGTTAEATTGAATSEGSDSVTSSATSEATSGTTATATTGEPSTTTSATGSMTSGTSGGAACGCGANEYCAFALQSCGDDPNDVGTCTPRPDGCDAVFQPACGCDGKVYGNACSAAMEGIDVSAAGGCAPPEGFFPCGAGFCDLKTSYCEVQLSDVVGLPDTFTCKDLPNNCDPIGCACLKGLACADMCEVVDGGGLKVNCPGG